MSTHESAGIIYDIGFRHYDGPRLGRRQVVLALFAESARGAYGIGRSTRSKISAATTDRRAPLRDAAWDSCVAPQLS